MKKASLAKLKNGTQVIKLQFPFDMALIEKVREIPGRKWHRNDKVWSVPLYVSNILTIRNLGFALSGNLLDFEKEKTTTNSKILNKDIKGLNPNLFDFQKEGVAFIEANSGRALIADEMGLGKTVQALSWLALHPERYPALIVVPASLKLNWQREAERWIPGCRIQILSGTTPYQLQIENDFQIENFFDLSKNGGAQTRGGQIEKLFWEEKESNPPTKGGQIEKLIVIINYDILPSWVGTLQKIKFKVLIADECHYFKNNQAKRTKAVKQVSKSIPYIIALSGTPIMNRPVEAYNAIKLIEPKLFPSYNYYTNRYCAAYHDGFGWNYNGASNTEELHRILTSSIMLRRLKKDVLDDLPEKLRAFVPIELDNQSEYNKAENDFIAYVKSVKGSEAARKASQAVALTKIETLKQVAVKGKMKQVTEWIQNFLESGDKLVVFATHKVVIEHLYETFRNVSVKFDGSTTTFDRQTVVDRFQNEDKIQLFIGNIQAAGVGITLTAASNVVFLELPWTPGALIQAEDRLHRIGQKSNVTVHYLLAAGTIEERIAQLLDEKRKVLDAVLDGVQTEDTSLLMTIMNEYGN